LISIIKHLAKHGITIEILELHQSSIATGNDSDALTLIEYRTPTGTGWAGGRDTSVLTASLNAVLQAARATKANPK
jgi:2-isopropylmalate synthase